MGHCGPEEKRLYIQTPQSGGALPPLHQVRDGVARGPGVELGPGGVEALGVEEEGQEEAHQGEGGRELGGLGHQFRDGVGEVVGGGEEDAEQQQTNHSCNRIGFDFEPLLPLFFFQQC